MPSIRPALALCVFDLVTDRNPAHAAHNATYSRFVDDTCLEPRSNAPPPPTCSSCGRRYVKKRKFGDEAGPPPAGHLEDS